MLDADFDGPGVLLDVPTLRVWAAQLEARLRGRRLHGAAATAAALILLWRDGPGEAGAAAALELDFGPPGVVRLPASTVQPTAGLERYLAGARVEAVEVIPGRRVLCLRLSRPGADGGPTYGSLYLELSPPRFRALLCSQRHGRLLAVWAGAGDRRAPGRGDAVADLETRRGPTPDTVDQASLQALLTAAGQACLDVALRRGLSGLDRHLVACACAAAGLEPTAVAASCDAVAVDRLHAALGSVWTVAGPKAFRWPAGGGCDRVSLVPPPGQTPCAWDSVSAALQAAGGEPDRRCALQRRRLRRGQLRLRRRERAVVADLEEAGQADLLERTGAALMATPGRVAPGRDGEVPDVHDTDGGTIAVTLAPGETQSGRGARLLKRAARLRRRRQVLPARLRQIRVLLADGEHLLARLETPGAAPLSEEEMEDWQGRADLRERSSGRAGPPNRQPGVEARPRRYLTSSGWSVWAGRNNRENDVLTHRLAAQNDVWFHAHGYAGAHVLLRREGRKEEPSTRTLEEAAAVAAYWSKGRTAKKVPVVYTLAKYVSKPRGGTPGLAVMKREKTIVVRPSLLQEEESQT